MLRNKKTQKISHSQVIKEKEGLGITNKRGLIPVHTHQTTALIHTNVNKEDIRRCLTYGQGAEQKINSKIQRNYKRSLFCFAFSKPSTHPKLPCFLLLLLLLLSTKHVFVQLLKAHAPFFVEIYGLRWLPACYAPKTHSHTHINENTIKSSPPLFHSKKKIGHFRHPYREMVRYVFLTDVRLGKLRLYLSLVPAKFHSY